ncbi:MAG: hypothetical protein HYR51_17545 [Candidatus Rokubacteria bacterium]|nr:hypothetical protein [Candidatus Rokubacteria bacterium]
MQSPVPAHPPPDQPAKTDPAAGVAVSRTSAPKAKGLRHALPQSIPCGRVVTVPAPLRVTVRATEQSAARPPNSNAPMSTKGRSPAPVFGAGAQQDRVRPFAVPRKVLEDVVGDRDVHDGGAAARPAVARRLRRQLERGRERRRGIEVAELVPLDPDVLDALRGVSVEPRLAGTDRHHGHVGADPHEAQAGHPEPRRLDEEDLLLVQHVAAVDRHARPAVRGRRAGHGHAVPGNVGERLPQADRAAGQRRVERDRVRPRDSPGGEQRLAQRDAVSAVVPLERRGTRDIAVPRVAGIRDDEARGTGRCGRHRDARDGEGGRQPTGDINNASHADPPRDRPAGPSRPPRGECSSVAPGRSTLA